MEYPFSFKSPSSPHEEVPTTSLEPKVHLDDVIERIKSLIINENSTPSQLVEKTRLS
jgi:hypothetical protein